MPDTEINLNAHLHWLFPTPVLIHRREECEALNGELRDFILKSESSGDLDFTNLVGGRATKKDFFARDAGCVRELWRYIESLVTAVVKGTSELSVEESAQFGFEAWANVMKREGYHRPHTHFNCFWSGAYYVSLGDPDPEISQNGWIELFDPRSAAGAIKLRESVYQEPCLIEPEPGLTIMFPGWIKHMVHPFRGKGERISVSFNLLHHGRPMVEE